MALVVAWDIQKEKEWIRFNVFSYAAILRKEHSFRIIDAQ